MMILTLQCYVTTHVDVNMTFIYLSIELHVLTTDVVDVTVGITELYRSN